VDAGDVPCPLYTVLELAEDEEWYKEAYGVYNKKKFGSGEAPGEDDRVTKFFYDGEAYDGTVAEVRSLDTAKGECATLHALQKTRDNLMPELPATPSARRIFIMESCARPARLTLLETHAFTSAAS